MKNIGFTLMELMITVAIIGILAAIAIPSYTSYVQRGRMAQAYTDIQLIANTLEKCYSDRGTYTDWTTLSTNYGLKIPSSTKYYNLGITQDGTSFTVTATPKSGAWSSARVPCMTSTFIQGYIYGGSCTQEEWKAK